jgi:hypothetical protein
MDLSKLIQASGLRFDFVAEKLFPTNKHPYNALLRLINKKAELSESQITTLAEMLGASPNDLLGASPRWKGALDAGNITLSFQNFEAIYTPAVGVYTLYQSGAYVGTFATELGVSVREFIKTLNEHLTNL